ncbi:winged helix-turn-helix domain-containing protein [Thalassotalea sp. 1_MG-2023]|uniref:winged helix-turn-helix domain-containing protein n=1 Tax=Thalassotalea sp. 1_MG-2023 TaxID=3062680 RepID=UPI0026E1CEFF|nr:winged helix-turn-helix domain-containing protein [Thalassotalea sp. 1_MG-2023]MDO6428107.1 winged helix-turn-helix domain-containing protein [Thalassotalea sp. 1_MG-2023]
MISDSVFTIGQCQVIPIEYAICFSEQEKQSIQPKFIELLCYLAKEYPRVIPRDELIENVWNGNQYVGEKALTNAIWHLRQNLQGAAGDSEVIETIRKVGYRLLIEPVYLPVTEPPTPLENESQLPTANQAPKGVIALAVALIGLLAIVVMQLTQPKQYNDLVVSEITKEPGTELFASPSPDGQQIVFKWSGEQADNNLYVKDRTNDKHPPKQLTFGNNHLSHSVWSNDGQYLYFAKRAADRSQCQVIQLKIKTREEKPIADCPLKGGYYYIDISPDDKTLAFHGFHEPAENNGIYFIDLTDQQSQPIRFSCSRDCGYKDRDFKFSPDGKHIAVTRRVSRFNENIYLVNLASKKATPITYNEEDIVGLTWHPSGKKLVYAAQRADRRTGHIVDIAKKKTVKIDIDGFSYPAFANKSGELFFQQRSEKYHLATLALDSDIVSTPFPLIQSEFSHHHPHYSKQQNKIAYVSNESGFYELWLTDTSGKNRTQLTFLERSIRYPRWSHDGSKIAFLAPIEGNESDRIYIYHMDTQKLSIVPSQHKEHNRPTWSWQDDAIISAVYESEYVDLHQIDITTGESKRLTFDGGRFGVMTSPSTLVYTANKKGLWQKELDNNLFNDNPLEKLSGKVFRVTYAWEYTNQGIYYRKNYRRYHLISFYSFATQTITPLVKLPKGSLGSYTNLSTLASIDTLLFTQADSPQSDIKKLTHPFIQN